MDVGAVLPLQLAAVLQLPAEAALQIRRTGVATISSAPMSHRPYWRRVSSISLDMNWLSPVESAALMQPVPAFKCRFSLPTTLSTKVSVAVVRTSLLPGG